MLYEYKCKCGEKFEARQPLELRQTALCPKCGSVAAKVFSVINATFTWVIDSIKSDTPRRYHDPYIE